MDYNHKETMSKNKKLNQIRKEALAWYDEVLIEEAAAHRKCYRCKERIQKDSKCAARYIVSDFSPDLKEVSYHIECMIERLNERIVCLQETRRKLKKLFPKEKK